MIGSPYLEGRDRYERVTDGWVDNTHDDAFTHTVCMTDDDFGIEVAAVCTPSPGYEVREARARVLSGSADPAIAAAFDGLAGSRMVGGFTRRLADLCGDRPGARLFVDAGIEVARLARQATKLPAERTARLDPGDARQCWELDTTGWADLPGSCFTYSPAGRALLGTRPVSTPMVRELYTPAPGARKIFVRRRLSRLVRTGRRLHLFHAMHDNVHGFDLHYEIDLDRGVIVAADSITSRLPYLGICNEPQGKIASLIGEPADAGLRERIQTLIGDEAGCAQLYDLTADLLKLLSLV
ncbi:MAG TPA: DUF2889 domain-containing protein [Methylomirabilota bacterium]|nr:DUF2889 domain-containing protein [Methylomirabilota bacterium]